MNFKLFNIPVYVNPTFWVFLLIFGNFMLSPLSISLTFMLVLIISLLIHELGHAFVARYYGGRPQITLEAFGGHVNYEGSLMTPQQEFFITLAGPLCESVLIPLSFYLLKSRIFAAYPDVQYLLYVMYKINIIWCLFNLIPVLPLDGGHLFPYLVGKVFGEKGKIAAIKIGYWIGIASLGILFGEKLYVFSFLLFYFLMQNRHQFIKDKMPGKNSFNQYTRGVEALKSSDFEKAKALLRPLLKISDTKIRHWAIESMAECFMNEKEEKKAYELLLKSNHQELKTGKCLLCKLAFERKNYALIRSYSREIYQIEPTYESSLLNSKAFAGLNEAALSGAWLQTASQFET